MESFDQMSPAEPANQLQTRQQSAVAPRHDLSAAGPQGGREWHNFTGQPRDIWRLKALAQSEAQSGLDVAGETIPLKWWYLQEVQVYDQESGEYQSSVRTVLMRPDCSCIAFVSGGMVKAMQSLVEAIGIGPYDPPIGVLVQEIVTRNKRRMYTLVPAE